jgi:hypothetical protein
VRSLGEIGPVGDESAGVDVASSGDRSIVGWRDADAFGARAWIAPFTPGRLGEARSINTSGSRASAPSLLFVRGVLHSAWTESWIDGKANVRGHLVAAQENAGQYSSLVLRDIEPRVRLSADRHGAIVALRDRASPNAHSRSFVGRLDEELHVGRIESPGRADDDQSEPAVVSCGAHLFSLATRRSSRQVTMVSVHRLDEELHSAEPEQQIYEYHARFPQAVAVCVGGDLLIAFGERQTIVSPLPRLQTVVLHCGPGVAHERTPDMEGQVLRKRGAG